MVLSHKELGGERWLSFSLPDQLAHIGSEVERALSWQKKGEEANMKSSLWRALELIDLTISDYRWRGRLKEILWLRGVLCDYFLAANSFGVSPRILRQYFLQFGILSAVSSGR